MKKVWILITLIMLLFTIYVITTSYAKYVSNATAVVQKEAGAWVIKVNNSDIASANTTETFNIDTVNFTSNEFVVENKAAPSSEGYFDIVIDPTGTSVAIRFDIQIGLEDLEIISFKRLCKIVDDEEVTEGIVRTDGNIYSGVIPLSEVKAGDLTTLRVYVKWEDDETGESDTNDSIIGTNRGRTEDIPVQVTVSQYSGEELVQYE